MLNITSNLAKHLRGCSVSLFNTPIRGSVYSKTLNSDTTKQRNVTCEPVAKLKDLESKPTARHKDDNGHKIAYMATYSAYDPCATHPILLSSTLFLSVCDTLTKPLIVSTPNPTTKTHGTPSIADPVVPCPSITSSIHRAGKFRRAIISPTPTSFKPWPYSLPKFLQPKVGTTYDLVYGEGGSDAAARKFKLGIMQKVLYGVPEPGKYEQSEGEEDGKAAQ